MTQYYELPFHSLISKEDTNILESMQSQSCKDSMIHDMEHYLALLDFQGYSEKLMAEDMFKKGWMISKYLKRTPNEV